MFGLFVSSTGMRSKLKQANIVGPAMASQGDNTVLLSWPSSVLVEGEARRKHRTIAKKNVKKKSTVDFD